MPHKNILPAGNSELTEYLTQLLGNELNDFLEAVPQDRSIRLNNLKNDTQLIYSSLSENATLDKLPFSPKGYKIIDEKSSLSHSLEFFRGYFAFQGASSQIPPLVLDPKPGDKVLDMAASPGSKTTQMAAMMQNRGILAVNDSNLNRMQALNTNTQKTGAINLIIYYLAGERLGRLFPEYFDKVLLDTPCTGLGTLASNPEVMSWWSYNKLDKLAKIQKQLIVSAIKAAKVGGEIVYSTCSVAPEENECIINDILQNYPIKLLPIENPAMQSFDDGFTEYKKTLLHPTLKNCKRIWPHKNNMEGFFVARLLKTGEYYNKNNPRDTQRIKTLPHSDPDLYKNLLAISESWGIDKETWQNYRYIKTRDRIWLLNGQIEEIIGEGFTNGGLLMAEERQKIWKLTHQSMQFFSDKITKRKISLSKPQIRNLFLKGRCNAPDNMNGYYALVIDDQPSASVYIENEEVRIKLTHPFHLP